MASSLSEMSICATATLSVAVSVSFHWENVYRKIIGIYRNFDGKLLNRCLATVSEVFFGANSTNSTVFVAIHTKSKILICLELLISSRNTVTA